MITVEQEITIIKSWAESCKTEVQLEHVNNFLNTKFGNMFEVQNEIYVDDISAESIDKINSLDLRSDLENDNIVGHILQTEGYVGNRPSDCKDEHHEDDTWTIDLYDQDGNVITSYLYTSKYEYLEDVYLLKQYV